MLSFFPPDVLDEIWDLIESISEGFLPTLPYHFKKIIVCYKEIGYNIDVLRQTACLVVNPVKVNGFAYLFYCTTVRRASD